MTITTDGKRHIKRYLAGFVPTIARSIAFGLGGKAEAVGDTKLQFEVGRSDILLTSYDFVNDKLIFKASVPENVGGKIYEVALFSMDIGMRGGELLVTFDSDEGWSDVGTGAAGTFTTTSARLGTNSLSHAPALSSSKADRINELFLDLSGYSGADILVFAYNVDNANTSSIVFRFSTNATNYYEFTLGSQAVGYKVVELAKGSATVTGAPSWSNISEIRVTTTSGAGGASAVQYDGIRIDSADTTNTDYVMVSREQLATAFTKDAGRTQEVEFTLSVAV